MDTETIIAITAIVALVLGGINLVFRILDRKSGKEAIATWKGTTEELKKVVDLHNTHVFSFKDDIRDLKEEIATIRNGANTNNQVLAPVEEPRMLEVTPTDELRKQELELAQREQSWRELEGFAKAFLWLSERSDDYEEDEY